MGWREAAYFKYLKGKGGTLDSVPPENLPYLQEMAARAYMKQGANQGQLLYADYAFSPDEKTMDIARTIGKTAPGNITREGNNWRVKDVYNFYSEGWDKDLERSKKLLMSGDFVGALSAMSPHVGKAYNVDVTVPMTAEQIKMFEQPSSIDMEALQKDSFQFGDQEYTWKKHQLGRNDSAVAIAGRQFADNPIYKAEGSNLKKMVDMVYAKNNGKVAQGDLAWIPEVVEVKPINQTVANTPSKSSGGLDLLNRYLGAISNGLKKEVSRFV
jgi:hypothetical protein